MLSWRMKKWDLAACALVLLLALALACALFLQGRGKEAVVVVSLEGETVYRGRLTGADTRVEVGGDYPLTVVIRGGQVWVETSSCPGGDCRRQGVISAPGQSIACLPDRVTIAIQGEAQVDLVVG